MNVSNLYRKIKQILNDSNIALVNKGLSESTSLNGVYSEIDKLEINRLPYLLRKEFSEINEDDLEGCTAIVDNAFYMHNNLASITIPDSVISIGKNAFFNTAYYKNSANWENNVLYIGKHLINAKTSLSGEYRIKDGTMVISEYAFDNCKTLTNITIPASVTNIGTRSFNNCTSLTNITMLDGVTHIGEYTFYNCTTLTNITIPASVTNVGRYAFYNAQNLTDIYLHPTTPPALDGLLMSATATTTIHVPIGSGDAYRNATNWSKFASKIVEDIVIE